MSSHFVAGCVGGISGVLVGYPFDTIRVRLQTQNQYSTYRNSFDCLKKTLLKEGAKGLYRGLSSPLIGSSLFKTINFGVYGSVLNKFNDQNNIKNIMIASTLSAQACGLLLIPVDRVKILLQTGKYKTPFEVFEKVGLKKIVKPGWGITMTRESIFGVVYLPTFAYLKKTFHNSLHTPILDQKVTQFIELSMAGAITGCVGWSMALPADVIKSKIQAIPPTQKIPNTFNAIVRHFQQEGVKGFYKGWRAAMIRALPTHATVLAVYQTVYNKLKN